VENSTPRNPTAVVGAGTVATHPGMAETLRGDWRKAAWFYARFGVTEGQFRQGTPSAGNRDQGATDLPPNSVLNHQFIFPHVLE
jgi:hypothetical protein